jgi:hypothetical protein
VVATTAVTITAPTAVNGGTSRTTKAMMKIRMMTRTAIALLGHEKGGPVVARSASVLHG